MNCAICDDEYTTLDFRLRDKLRGICFLCAEEGGFVGMTGFGASGPAEELYRLFNITPEAVVALAKELIFQK